NNQHKLLIIRFTLPTKNWHQQTDTLLRYQATRAHRHRAASAALLGGSVRLVGDPTRRLLVLRRSARIPTVADLRGLSNSAPCGPGLAVIAVRSGCDLATRPTHRFPSGLGRQRLLGASVLRSPLGVPAFGFRVLAADREEHYGAGGGSSNRSVHPHSASLQHIPAGHNVVRPGGRCCIRSDVTWVGEGGHEVAVQVVRLVPTSVGSPQFHGVTQAVGGLAGGRRECFGKQLAPKFPDQETSGRTVGGAGSGCCIGPSEGEQA